VPEVWELYVRCLITSGTSHSGVAVMEIVVLGLVQFGFGLKVLGLRFFDVGNLGWSVVVLGCVFSTLIAIFNIVDLFSFEASFLSECRNSTTLDALFYAFTHYHNVSELLGRTTHNMLVVWCLECVGK